MADQDEYEKELKDLQREIANAQPGDLPPLPGIPPQQQSAFQVLEEAASAPSPFDDPRVQEQARLEDPMRILTEGAGQSQQNPAGVTFSEGAGFSGDESSTDLIREGVQILRDMPRSIADELRDVFVLG
jgi:hypothetical protein